MKNKSAWFEKYKHEIMRYGGYEKYILKKSFEKKVLIKKILKYSNSKQKILEAGCGTGANSTYLASKNRAVIGIDADENMLTLAKNLAKNYNFPNKPSFKKMDMFNIKYLGKTFDVVFSHGVLEHFDNEDIKKIIKEGLKVGDRFIFSVPSSFFNENDKMYGDERFLSSNQWSEILSDFFIEEKFGFFYQNFFIRSLNFLLPKSVLLHSPYIGFVLKEKTKKNL